MPSSILILNWTSLSTKSMIFIPYILISIQTIDYYWNHLIGPFGWGISIRIIMIVSQRRSMTPISIRVAPSNTHIKPAPFWKMLDYNLFQKSKVRLWTFSNNNKSIVESKLNRLLLLLEFPVIRYVHVQLEFWSYLPKERFNSQLLHRSRIGCRRPECILVLMGRVRLYYQFLYSVTRAELFVFQLKAIGSVHFHLFLVSKLSWLLR